MYTVLESRITRAANQTICFGCIDGIFALFFFNRMSQFTLSCVFTLQCLFYKSWDITCLGFELTMKELFFSFFFAKHGSASYLQTNPSAVFAI